MEKLIDKMVKLQEDELDYSDSNCNETLFYFVFCYYIINVK